MIRIQQNDFEVAKEYQALRAHNTTGAIVTFCGLVREFTQATNNTMELQHYPGMTEKVLSQIEAQAKERWTLLGVTIIHRVGQLSAGEQIVFVGVSSAHRHEAFTAAEFIMDILKTEAPFWKKEGDKWLETKESDQQAAQKWFKP